MRISKRAAVLVPAVIAGTLALGVAPASAAPAGHSSCAADAAYYDGGQFAAFLGQIGAMPYVAHCYY